jgi:hypothetical protein
VDGQPWIEQVCQPDTQASVTSRNNCPSASIDPARPAASIDRVGSSEPVDELLSALSGRRPVG